MITDKDREDLIYDLRAYIDGWCLEEGKERDRLIEFENAVRAEAAEEARREAAERAVTFIDNNMIGLTECDTGILRHLRAAILKEATK